MLEIININVNEISNYDSKSSGLNPVGISHEEHQDIYNYSEGNRSEYSKRSGFNESETSSKIGKKNTSIDVTTPRLSMNINHPYNFNQEEKFESKKGSNPNTRLRKAIGNTNNL